MNTCPYCDSDCFVSATTAPRSVGQIVSGVLVGATWENECVGCSKWSLHKDDTGTQHALVDPTDRTSVEA